VAVVCPLRQKPLHRFPPLRLRIDYSQWSCGREGKTFDTGRRHHCGSSRDPVPYNPGEGAWLPSWSVDGGTIPVRSGEPPSVRLKTRDTMETVTHGRLTSNMHSTPGKATGARSSRHLAIRRTARMKQPLDVSRRVRCQELQRLTAFYGRDLLGRLRESD